jgi:hypothetical protein
LLNKKIKEKIKGYNAKTITIEHHSILRLISFSIGE